VCKRKRRGRQEAGRAASGACVSKRVLGGKGRRRGRKKGERTEKDGGNLSRRSQEADIWD